MSIFADVRFLIKQLRAAITPNRDIWDSIAIAVALDSLHDDFESTTTTMLERGNKSIDEIQQILASPEVKFVSKRATGLTGDLAMMSQGRGKRKVNSDDKCFNYGKLGHFERDCTAPSTKKKNKSDKSTNGHQRRNNKRNRVHIVAAQSDDDESDTIPFRPGKAKMAREHTRQQAPKRI